MDKTFKPTVEWMAKKYDEMNRQLFNNELGECKFAIFTTGRGSQGGVLGWFKVTTRGLRVERYDRRMFKQAGWDKVYVNRNNFVEICQPQIELNGNYSGTEQGFLATLVHEMCHYYTYMNGRCPRQGHGPEFKQIGQIVSSRSNGMFTIQRLASAEDMKQLELSDEMKEKKARRLANKKAAVSAIVVYTQEGQVKLTITSSQNLINLITKTELNERGNDVKISNDAEVIDFLFSKGYKKNMRSWRYWSLEGKPWINEFNTLLGEERTGGEERDIKEPVVPKRKKIFSIRTSNGRFECDATSSEELFKALKQRFPFTSDESLNKLINNPANYIMKESIKTTKDIISEVINDYINNDESIEITPDMNLGLHSPLEMR